MENIKTLISICFLVLCFISSLLSLLMKNISNIKKKKNLENILNIFNEIIPLIEEAEAFIDYDGEEKKEYVISRIIKILNNKGEKIDTDMIESMIETLVSFSKEVNYSENIDDDKSLEELF